MLFDSAEIGLALWLLTTCVKFCHCSGYQCSTAPLEIKNFGLGAPIIGHHNKSLVECRAFASPEVDLKNFLNIVRCCVDPDILLAKGAQVACRNYSLTVYQMQSPQLVNCSASFLIDQSEVTCCETKLWENFVYNITVQSNCLEGDDFDDPITAGQNHSSKRRRRRNIFWWDATTPELAKEEITLSNKIVFTNARSFTGKDEESYPLSKEAIWITNVTNARATVSWEIPRCTIQSLVQFRSHTGEAKFYNISCSELISKKDWNPFCFRGKNISLPLERLKPYSKYDVSVSIKSSISMYWSQPTIVTFRTMEALPLTGPEISPGVVFFKAKRTTLQHCADVSKLPLEMLIHWKELKDETITRGRIEHYFVKLDFTNASNSTLAVYENYTNGTNVTVTISPFGKFCQSDLSIKVWSGNSAGQSLNYSSAIVKIDELFKRKEIFQFDINGTNFTVTALPPGTEVITFYFAFESNGSVVGWTSQNVINMTLPFFILTGNQMKQFVFDNETTLLELYGVSADCLLSTCQSTGIIKVPPFDAVDVMETDVTEISSTYDLPPSSIPVPIAIISVSIFFLVLLAMGFCCIVLYIRKGRQRKKAPRRRSTVMEPIRLEMEKLLLSNKPYADLMATESIRKAESTSTNIASSGDSLSRNTATPSTDDDLSGPISVISDSRSATNNLINDSVSSGISP